MSPTTDTVLKTDRLTLRPFEAADAPTVRKLCGDWQVARMLAVVPHPYPHGLAEKWIAGQPARLERGVEFTFAIECAGALVGSIALTRKGEAEDASYELGYWVGVPWWGQGIASEAAERLVRFAFEALGARRLTSGYFDENPASGRVLEKCGFRVTGTGLLPCPARAHPMHSTLVECVNPAAAESDREAAQ